ncbi:hypothetical protein C8Q80DRAFT_117940 [Daedaleopsis nitida]|nr:hypothetical protein C8Q80DRAFT_117940 [Daedaleopsis nitida]
MLCLYPPTDSLIMSSSQQSYSEYANATNLRQVQALLPPFNFPQQHILPQYHPHDPRTLAQQYAALAPRSMPAPSVSPPHMYAAPPTAVFDPARSAVVLQTLQSVIESTHTSQVQRAVAQNIAPYGALTGALDPSTGDFQPVVQHQRLRTQHACDACRKRKAKCSGHGRCKRCVTRNLACNYGERNMRGPNKRKRAEAELDNSSGDDNDNDYANAIDNEHKAEQEDAQAEPNRPRGFSVSSISSATSDAATGSSSSSQASTSRSDARRDWCGYGDLDGPPPARRPRASTFPASASGQATSSRAAGGRRQRPPSMSFAGLREDVPRLLAAEYARNVEFTFRAAVQQEPIEKPDGEPEHEMPVHSGRSGARPMPLPAYLVDTYSRAALNVVHESEPYVCFFTLDPPLTTHM